MDIVHHPFVVRLGSTVISGYGIALVLAFAVAWAVLSRHAKSLGDRSDIATEIILATATGGLLGSKLSYSALAGGPLFVQDGHGFWGGLLGGACGYWIWTRLRSVRFDRYLDAIGIAVAAGYTVGRTGCWAVGDDYGRLTDFALAVRFPEGAPPTTAANMLLIFGESPLYQVSPDTVLGVHPTQLYEVFLGFVIFALLWRLRSHAHSHGWLFGVYCLLAGLERFVIEFVRAQPDRLSIGISAAQLISLVVGTIGALLMYAKMREPVTSPQKS